MSCGAERTAEIIAGMAELKLRCMDSALDCACCLEFASAFHFSMRNLAISELVSVAAACRRSSSARTGVMEMLPVCGVGAPGSGALTEEDEGAWACARSA